MTRRLGNAARRALPPLVGLVVLLSVWQFVHSLHIWRDFLFPAPIEVWRSLQQMAGDGLLWLALKVTIRRLFWGFGLSLAIGTLLASAFVLSPLLWQGMRPFLLGMQAMPGLAWIPLTIIWFGYHENAILFVTVIGSVFSITMGIADGFANAPPIYGKAARNMGASGAGLLFRVTIPAATPYLVLAAKTGWAFAWRSLVGAEIVIASLGGLGFLLQSGRDFGDVSQVMATMVIVLVLGMAIDRLVFARLEIWVRRRWGLDGSK